MSFVLKKRMADHLSSSSNGSSNGLGEGEKRLKEEQMRQQCILNQNFLDFCSQADKFAKWEDAARDYEHYTIEISQRYSWGVTAADGAALFSFGSGDCGQLGHGVSDPPVEEEETSVAKPKKVMAFENSKNMRLVESGGLSNGVVDSKGLWTWGCADDGALGREGDENIPALVSFPMSVIVTSLSLGESHGACVSLSGQAFMWGAYRDKEGKTFFPTTAIVNGNPKPSGKNTTSRAPVELANLSNIIACASGANHTLLLSGDGVVFSLGLGEQKQLGRSVSTEMKSPHPTDPDAEPVYNLEMMHRDHLTPKKVPGLPTIRGIGCGAYHSLAISSNRFTVYGWGLNQYRQVTAVQKEGDALEVTQLKQLDGRSICYVKGGEHFSLALSLNGEVYTWGRSDQGQLGRDVADKAGAFEDIPKQVQKLPPIAQVYCGSSHVLAKTRSGQVFSWGFGEMLQLGHGESTNGGSGSDQRVPKHIEAIKGQVYRVSAGAQHSCVLVGDPTKS